MLTSFRSFRPHLHVRQVKVLHHVPTRLLLSPARCRHQLYFCLSLREPFYANPLERSQLDRILPLTQSTRQRLWMCFIFRRIEQVTVKTSSLECAYRAQHARVCTCAHCFFSYSVIHTLLPPSTCRIQHPIYSESGNVDDRNPQLFRRTPAVSVYPTAQSALSVVIGSCLIACVPSSFIEGLLGQRCPSSMAFRAHSPDTAVSRSSRRGHTQRRKTILGLGVCGGER